MKFASSTLAIGALLSLCALSQASYVTVTRHSVVTITAGAELHSPQLTRATTTISPTSLKKISSATAAHSTHLTSSTSSSPNSSSSSTGSKGLSTFQKTTLDDHNSDRSKAGVADLSWDSGSLQSQADSYAKKLCSIGKLQHSGVKMGENLYWVSSSNVAEKKLANDAVKAWYDEKSYYSESNEKSFHYSQLVWKGTTKVACSYSDCGSGKGTYVVCNYSPQGNIVGKFKANVP